MTRRFLSALALLAAWTLPGLITAVVQLALFPTSLLVRDNMAAYLVVTSVSWWSWAAFTPLIVMVTRRLGFEREDLGRSAIGHLALALSACAVYTLWYAWTLNLTRPASLPPVTEPFWMLVRGYIVSRLVVGLVCYSTIVGLTIAIDERSRRRRHEMEAATLAADLAQAQLQTLQMQLQPHFLFNTLHAISMLVQENPPAASRMIAQLGELLRLTLRLVDIPEITVREELELLARYLAIEETRFGDRLTVNLSAPDDVQSIMVPSFLLQPLVENAVRHGVAPRTEPGRVDIRAEREGDRLRFIVDDDGPGIPDNGQGTGIGLSATRERLALRYGTRASLRCETRTNGGGRSTIELPIE